MQNIPDEVIDALSELGKEDRWVARDYTGEWAWFQEKPRCYDGIWFFDQDTQTTREFFTLVQRYEMGYSVEESRKLLFAVSDILPEGKKVMMQNIPNEVFIELIEEEICHGWIAQDANGNWWMYDEKPRFFVVGWWAGKGRKIFVSEEIRNNRCNSSSIQSQGCPIMENGIKE